MEFIPFILIAAVMFGLCYLFDKGFTKLFRSRVQHISGRAVRANKRNGSLGMILVLIGIGALVGGAEAGWPLFVGCGILILVGIGLIVYYLSFGIYYDDDSFLYSTFGKKSVSYRYNQIKAQQLYVVQGGHIVVELHLTDGKTVQVQLHFKSAEDFLNTAFLGWVRQRNLDMRQGDWDFYDPDNSCWFPKVEEK